MAATSQIGSNPDGVAAAKRILLVDDDTETRDEVSALLRDEGYEVATSDHGRDALDRLHERTADLIILDLRMPVMDGWQFRTIQRADPDLSEIPVIAVSADDSPQAAAVHADQYLRKPLKVNELLVAVERILLGRERQRLADNLRSTERIAVLATIAAGVGHEINNPLTYVLGNLEVLLGEVDALDEDLEPVRRHALVAELRAKLEDVRTGADRIRGVVETFRWLSRPRLERHGPVDVSRMLETSIAIASNEIRHRARLDRRLEPVPPLHGDEARLGQVFVNLLVNAAQAIAPGATESHRIWITTSSRDDQVVVEVGDTGQGIPRDLQAKIFEPFFSTKDPAAGTGLGLAISQNIVHEHGGRIEVESATGQGSVFRVLLPLHGRSGSGGAPKPPPAGLSTTRPMRVMVIDDDELILTAIRRILRTRHEVVTMGGPAEALTYLQGDRRFDAILCDLMMPDTTGMAFHEQLARVDPALASRIVFMTGGAFAPEARDFLDRARVVCVDKPFSRDDLLAALMAVRPRSEDGVV